MQIPGGLAHQRGKRKGRDHSWRITSGRGWRAWGSEPAVLPVVLSVMLGGSVRGWASGSRAGTVRGVARFSAAASGGGGRHPAARAVSISRNRRKSGSTSGGRLTNGATKSRPCRNAFSRAADCQSGKTGGDEVGTPSVWSTTTGSASSGAITRKPAVVPRQLSSQDRRAACPSPSRNHCRNPS